MSYKDQKKKSVLKTKKRKRYYCQEVDCPSSSALGDGYGGKATHCKNMGVVVDAKKLIVHDLHRVIVTVVKQLIVKNMVVEVDAKKLIVHHLQWVMVTVVKQLTVKNMVVVVDAKKLTVNHLHMVMVLVVKQLIV